VAKLGGGIVLQQRFGNFRAEIGVNGISLSGSPVLRCRQRLTAPPATRRGSDEQISGGVDAAYIVATPEEMPLSNR
jgi:outer membrane PBP1 activator LpoA protein